MNLTGFVEWIYRNPIPSVIVVLTIVYLITLHANIKETREYTEKIYKLLSKENEENNEEK